jgi:hypothetical protein
MYSYNSILTVLVYIPLTKKIMYSQSKEVEIDRVRRA